MSVSLNYFTITGFAFPVGQCGDASQLPTANALHSPAQVLQKLLIDFSFGFDGTVTSPPAWSCYASSEPDSPDNCITVYDTAGKTFGREQILGDTLEHYGLQFKVRSSVYDVGWLKAHALAQLLDESVRLNTVTVPASANAAEATYVVFSVNRTGPILPLGKDTPGSKRNVFTVNATAAIRRVAT